MNQQFNTISLDQAIQVAPAIAATSPHPRIKSPKYAFTNTVEIVVITWFWKSVAFDITFIWFWLNILILVG